MYNVLKRNNKKNYCKNIAKILEIKYTYIKYSQDRLSFVEKTIVKEVICCGCRFFGGHSAASCNRFGYHYKTSSYGIIPRCIYRLHDYGRLSPSRRV
jgi:hypothetical protein